MGNGVGLGTPTLLTVKNPRITYSWIFVHVVPPYLWVHHICGSAFTESAYHGLFGAAVFTVEKHLHVRDPTRWRIIVQGSPALSLLVASLSGFGNARVLLAS